MITRSTSFNDEFKFFLNKFKRKENFNLLRFSDGEIYMLKGKKYSIRNLYVSVEGRIKGLINHPSYERKSFHPVKDQLFIEKLLESFMYESKEYFKGISCKCCIGKELWDWQLNTLGGDNDNLTWSNVLLNSNFPLFMQDFYPEIKNRGAYIICNEHAVLDQLDWLKGDYRRKTNDYTNLELIDSIKDDIKRDKIKNQVFLFSSSAFSNVAQYELAKLEPNNTYIDIGTTLSYELQIPSKRDYLLSYYGLKKNDLKKCKWN